MHFPLDSQLPLGRSQRTADEPVWVLWSLLRFFSGWRSLEGDLGRSSKGGFVMPGLEKAVNVALSFFSLITCMNASRGCSCELKWRKEVILSNL